MEPEHPGCEAAVAFCADSWREHRRRTSLEANLRRAGISEEAFWERYASWVEAMRGDYPGVLLSRVHTYLAPGQTLLDIGAGAGAFVIPLARSAQHVTAVEPSPAQIQQLRRNIDRDSVRNITIIERKWEDIDVDTLGSHDLVLAVHSFQMPDIAAALRSMCRVAAHRLLLIHTAGHNLASAIQELFGIEPGPDYAYLSHVIHSLGYDPVIEFADYDYEVPLDLQMDILSYNPGLNTAQCGRLRDYVRSRGMVSVRDGNSWLRRSCRDALISVSSP
jgi:SAM-dependent methyltransferase